MLVVRPICLARAPILFRGMSSSQDGRTGTSNTTAGRSLSNLKASSAGLPDFIEHWSRAAFYKARVLKRVAVHASSHESTRAPCGERRDSVPSPFQAGLGAIGLTTASGAMLGPLSPGTLGLAALTAAFWHRGLMDIKQAEQSIKVRASSLDPLPRACHVVSENCAGAVCVLATAQLPSAGARAIHPGKPPARDTAVLRGG